MNFLFCSFLVMTFDTCEKRNKPLIFFCFENDFDKCNVTTENFYLRMLAKRKIAVSGKQALIRTVWA